MTPNYEMSSRTSTSNAMEYLFRDPACPESLGVASRTSAFQSAFYTLIRSGPGTNFTYLSSPHLCLSGMTFHREGAPPQPPLVSTALHLDKRR